MNRFTLKIIMLIFLILDSIATFIKGTPFFFHYFGMIVMPMAIFLLVDGFFHTKSRQNYLKRLLVFGEIMFLGNIVVSFIKPENLEGNLINIKNLNGAGFIWLLGIFVVALVMLFLTIKDKIYGYKGSLVIIFLLSIADRFLYLGFNGKIYILRNNMFLALAAILVLLIWVEEGKNKKDKNTVLKGLIAFAVGIFTETLIIGPAFGFLAYKYRKNFRMIVTSLFVISALFVPGFSISLLLRYPKWMMFFAVIFIYFYNGKEGKSIKKPFYILYPLAIWIPFLIGRII